MYDSELVHYIVVTGILIKDGKYLIAKRAEWEKAFPGKWTVPGGKVKVLDYSKREKDTSQHWYCVLEDVLRKEVKEEAGLDVQNIGYVTSMVYMRSDNVPCLIVSFYAELVDGEVKLCEALTDYAWIGIEEAKKYDLVEGMYDELIMLDEFLKTGKHMTWKKYSEKQNN